MLYKNFAKQEEIDLEYNPRLTVNEIDPLLNAYLENSRRVLRDHENQLNISYGPTLAEHFDFFPAKKEGAPLHVFIHGGYWHSFSSKDFAQVAEAFILQGINVALINYALCPLVTIDEIVRQCRAALAFLYKNSLELAYNPEQISISGHSAGAHLVGMMLSTDWKGQYALPADLIKSGCAISGLFDLSPFPYSWLQPKLQFSWDQVARNSPILHLPKDCGPVIVSVGGDESQEFHQQSEKYADLLKNQGHEVTHLIMPGLNHFTIINDFLGEGGKLFEQVLETIG
ncbi:MAG: alpha/beta hydrolase [SAR324 cluster bacterium]|nr:alpha/beta hydrolase [SAR324 cluster bacterium]